MLKHQEAYRWSVVILLPIAMRMFLQIFFNTNPLYSFSHLALPFMHGFFTIDPNMGFVSQTLPALAVKLWLHGIVPWWNPYAGIGMPLAGEMQSGAFSPLVLLHVFPAGVLLFQLVLQILAGVGTYLFLKEFGCAGNNALAGALLFEFNGTFAWLAHSIINPLPFLPLPLYALERIIKFSKTQTAGGWQCLAIIFALSIYAGYPEVAYINDIFILFYGLVRLASLPRSERAHVLVNCFLGLLVGTLLAAPILIAFTDYLQVAYTGSHLNGEFSHGVLPLDFIAVNFFPYLYGKLFAYRAMHNTWGGIGGYFTALMVFVGCYSITLPGKKLLKTFLILWILLCLDKSYGILPFKFLLNWVPLLKYTAFYRYYNSTVSLALILLVMLTLEQQPSLEQFKKNILPFSIFMGSLLGGLIAIKGFSAYNATTLSSGFISTWFLASCLWGIVSLSLASYWLGTGKLNSLKILLVVEAITFFIVPMFDAPRHPQLYLGGVKFLQKNLGLQRFYTLGPIAPNYGSYFQISEINYNDLPLPRSWVNYTLTQLDPYVSQVAFAFEGFHYQHYRTPTPLTVFLNNIDKFAAVGVKYLVTRNFVEAPLARIYQDEIMNIYALPDPKPYYEIISGTCSLAASSKTEVMVDCSSDAELLRREQYMPGWEAFINQQKTTVQPYQELFQTISLPPGKSRISYNFTPPYMPWGWGGLCLGLLILTVRRPLYSFGLKTAYAKE